MHEKVNENKVPRIFVKVKCLQNELNSIIESNKQKYYSRLSKKLVDPMTNTKSYWSTLKMFLNNKKIPYIPPLRHQNKYVTDFKEKTEIFNFFAEQYSLINNSTKLPSTFLKRTDEFISSISFSSNDIAKIVRNLDLNKAHSHDMISIGMLKICGESISKPLGIIFRSCIEKGLESGINLHDDLEKISNWAFQWKMSFNPDINKQALEFIFSRKLQMSNHPAVTFNGTSVTQSEIQKLGMFLDSKVAFKEHLQNVLNKVSETIELLRKL